MEAVSDTASICWLHSSISLVSFWGYTNGFSRYIRKKEILLVMNIKNRQINSEMLLVLVICLFI